MRTLTALTRDQLTQARSSADMMLSEKYRSYLPGRMLALLVSRYRDDVADALHEERPELPARDGQVRRAVLDELTGPELDEIAHVVLGLLSYADTMDDPALPALLREFRQSLLAARTGAGARDDPGGKVGPGTRADGSGAAAATTAKHASSKRPDRANMRPAVETAAVTIVDRWVNGAERYDRLPARTDMERCLRVSATTIKDAMQILGRMGVLERANGTGPWVVGDPAKWTGAPSA